MSTNTTCLFGNRTGRAVSTLEVIQHHLAEMGHGNLLETERYADHKPTRQAPLQRPPYSGSLVQTGRSSAIHFVAVATIIAAPAHSARVRLRIRLL